MIDIKKPDSSLQLIHNSQMAYFNKLRHNVSRLDIAEGLRNHLTGDRVDDVELTYGHPTISDNPSARPSKPLFPLKIEDLRLPARIDYPLIPYPEIVRQYIRTHDEKLTKSFHAHHHSHLKLINDTVSLAFYEKEWNTNKIDFDISYLKELAKLRFSHRTEAISLATSAYAKRATEHDLSIGAMNKISFNISRNMISPYMSFLIMIQRLRVHIAMQKKDVTSEYKSTWTVDDEAIFKFYKNGTYSYGAVMKEYRFALVCGGGHFRFFHSDLKQWFAGPMAYLDYAFTVADILNNIEVIRCSEEYEWASDFLGILISTASINVRHNLLVNFMKELEGFMLNLSDYDESYAMNWRPLMESVDSLSLLDSKITGCKYDLSDILEMLHGNNSAMDHNSLLKRVVNCCMKLERRQIQELSSLHKFIFYAEVDSMAGVKKFLSRVHTDRPIDVIAVKNLTRLAKQLFFTAYHSRHKSPPNMKGNENKIKLLEIYCNRSDIETITKFPLSWWDDVIIFNCMDNTLTGDALEFAKDKGALKEEVYFGPGDSRKELLQVIEQPNYTLTDFFKDAPFIPKPQKIVSTNHRRDRYITKHPVRLIPKEREQKDAARLFANGKLADKHALSLVTTRMKKALSYFDEQLMTPTDKKRKELIHEAAQSLAVSSNYSLLLDIEGHNQSMQAHNTSELSEFLGHLFGCDDWRTLPDYFSQIDVYHYEEYTDEVIHSTGQKGGIEGWLNPLWTLHTTLMMKLIRHMTDIEMPSTLIYSDDVNSIVSIPQASEQTVQSVFNKIIAHCIKFGMIVKFSQTNLSKHRVTMLRQHYADGIRADSTLKKLISISGANNPMLVSEEVEIAGICSSAASALELSNHSNTCCYLKNYKIGLLMIRLPHMILSHPKENSYINTSTLPPKLNRLLYYLKDDKSELLGSNFTDTLERTKNDVAAYLSVRPVNLNARLLTDILKDLYGQSRAETRFIDGPDRMLYLQIYDNFVQDLLFFWNHLPSAVGGLGAIFHLNLMLSGHSNGFSKSMHYLLVWAAKYSSEPKFFLNYIEVALSVDLSKQMNTLDTRCLMSSFPNDITICTAHTSINQSIKNMVKNKTRNKEVLQLFEIDKEHGDLQQDMVNIFRDDFHPRVAQFYYENTAVHFIDLLINKIETSSGLLTKIRGLTRLRNHLSYRSIENIRTGASLNRTTFGKITNTTDIVEYLLNRKVLMFPAINFVMAEEVLYDDKIEEVFSGPFLISIAKCSPRHYKDGKQVFDKPHVGNEVLYKGEFLDDDRMLGNKEEFLAAKLVAVTKWFLTKSNLTFGDALGCDLYNCVKACNVALSTLTGQKFIDLHPYTPTEVGGEILHRIPNIRFSTSTYIRSEMNLSLTYTAELNQRSITYQGLIDSNINFEYVMMRLLVSAMINDKVNNNKRIVQKFKLSNLIGIKDVQFMTPKIITYNPVGKYTIYGKSKNHNLSHLRFRYLAASFMHSDDINVTSAIPNLEQSNAIMQVGTEFLHDLIYKYSRNLDKDYMRIIPEYIDTRLWKPLMNKIMAIDSKFKLFTDLQWINYIRDSLSAVMNNRRIITTVSRNEKVKLTLQNQCFESLKEYKPRDKEYFELVKKQMQLASMNRDSKVISKRIRAYQNHLVAFNDHRKALAIALIIEYILYFHFITSSYGENLSFNWTESLNQFLNEGMHNVSLTIFCPELQIQIMILGREFIHEIIYNDLDDIKAILCEISTDNVLADIILPTQLPNLKPVSTITGEEILPEVVNEVIYSMEAIPYSAMATLNEIVPLTKFSHRCSTTGANPHVFTSITGSDSLSSQMALYRMLKSNFGIDNTYKICDLTGGRGDFQFVSRELNLTVDTYSKRDQFTMVYHHPNVSFDREYDIRRNETLKFVTQYDVVHVDVSFTGADRLEILDLILLLESSNIMYTIRLNSTTLNNYENDILTGLPTYSHYISYPTNASMKPYQIYLIGVPGEHVKLLEGPRLKSTVAFRSMALSYAKLLSPRNYGLKLTEALPNSMTIYFPTGMELGDTIIRICKKSLLSEQIYYSKRLISEVDINSRIYWVPSCLHEKDAELVELFARNATTRHYSVYEEYNENSLGNVSNNSRPYHEKHLQILNQSGSLKLGVQPTKADGKFLEYMRIHHPLQEERTKCNILMGCKKFINHQLESGIDSVVKHLAKLELEVSLKETLNQKEVQVAIKLLVLASSRNDYSYGVRYCHGVLLTSSTNITSPIRILRAYRLMSCYYDECCYLIDCGLITPAHIDAISHELEVREVQKIEHKKRKQTTLGDYMKTLTDTDIIDDTFDELFNSIENWASGITNTITSNEDMMTFDEENLNLNMNMDIGIEDIIEQAIVKLRLNEVNKHGFIDLGDDDYEEDNDW